MALELDDAAFGGAAYHGCNEALVLSRPDLIVEHPRGLPRGRGRRPRDRHRSPPRGSSSTSTAWARRRSRSTAGRPQLARDAADRFATPDRPRFVAGALGPTGMLISSSDPTLSKITFDELAELYGEQARALVEGGVDLLLIETSQDLLEMKAAIAGIVRAFDAGLRRVPIQAQATLDVTGRMLLGTDIRAVCATLDALPIDVIGLNCSTGPAAHARRGALSGRELALLRQRDPERRAAVDGAQRRDDLSRDARGDGARAARVRARIRRECDRRLLRDDARRTSRSSRSSASSSAACAADARTPSRCSWPLGDDGGRAGARTAARC